MNFSLKKNMWLKLASVGLAAMLWSAVVVIGQTVISVEAPVEYENLAEGVLVAETASRTVTLTLKGHERFLHVLEPDDLRVVLDMAGLGVGRHSYEVRDRDVKHPATVRLVRVKPALLNIRLEEHVERDTPVRAVITGLPMRGYAVRGVEVVPGSVGVKGAKSAVDRLRSLDAGPVDISGAIGDVAEEVMINAGQGVTITEDSVMIKVIIGKE
ncbi:MAG: hypothetical protein KAR83_00735 [Thermodesulfovibrionales bacterium]|nr:hypothetical protein [Thermodesulfovibrionales bacterium]